MAKKRKPKNEEPLKRYRVQYSFTEYDEIEVEAHTEEEAEQVAYDQIEADACVDSVELVEELDYEEDED